MNHKKLVRIEELKKVIEAIENKIEQNRKEEDFDLVILLEEYLEDKIKELKELGV